MSSEFILRIIGMIVFFVLGLIGGSSLGQYVSSTVGFSGVPEIVYTFVIGLVGALFGLILTPWMTTRPLRWLRNVISRVSPQSLLAALIGLVAGLIIAVLVAFPLSLLPSPFGKVLPFVGALIFGYLGVVIFVMRQHDLFNIFTGRGKAADKGDTNLNWEEGRSVLMDTSVIIDGRIADIAHTGFLQGSLLIPRFVLAELQYIADSPDNLRRQRGRRGMEVLSRLQKDPVMPVHLSDIDVEGVREVDDKLVILARQLRCPILTNDYNLNRIAELQGVMVLNVNELANAVKSVLLPGELLRIRVIQEGKEAGQGVGYLDDGTMVVIENGREYLSSEIEVVVTKVLQTAAGRMIFARLEEK